MAAEPAVTEFFSAWEIYRAVIDNDTMEHRAVYAGVHRILAERTDGYTLLDLGCGDAAGTGPAMIDTPVTRYVGVDCAAPALEFARRTLLDCPAEVELRTADLMDTVVGGEERYDVILAAFALHHFASADKRIFLTAARGRLKPGGEVVLIDVVRRDGESRAEYLERYEAHVSTWPLPVDARARIMAHVTGFDFPEEISVLPRWAAEQGYRTVEFYRGGRDTQCAWRLTPV